MFRKPSGVFSTTAHPSKVAFALGVSANAALHAEIDELPGHADAMPANARMRRVAELQEQLLERERYESALIERAANEGFDVPHRGDVDPRAFLGVTITQVQAQQVA